MKGKFEKRNITIELSLTEIDVLVLALNWAVDKSIAKQGAQTEKINCFKR